MRPQPPREMGVERLPSPLSDNVIAHRPLAIIKPVSHASLEKLSDEVLCYDGPWNRTHREYQSGGWWTLPLLHPTGSAQAEEICDGEARPTEALAAFPEIARWMSTLGLPLLCARLARLDPNGFLWEHEDYIELDGRPKLRLHLPLVTNSGAFLVLGGRRVHLATGFLWRLNPKHVHSACNFGLRARYHLIMDVYIDARVRHMMESEREADTSQAHPLREINSQELDRLLRRAERLIRLGFSSTAESLLLKAPCVNRWTHDAASSATLTSYDLVALSYRRARKRTKAAWWSERKKHYIRSQCLD
jgi:Aspartyl/Asparaginyl beta-hydroxylase